MDSSDLERSAYHHPRQGDLDPVERHAHKHRRHAGHADFGGEVERILGMVDGALVPSTRPKAVAADQVVVSKALKMGLKPIVVINKVDRDARPEEVVNEVFDPFAALEASDEQLTSRSHGSAKEGWMGPSPEGPKDQVMQPLFELVPATLRRLASRRDRSAFSAPSSKPIHISAVSSPGGSLGSIAPTSRSGCRPYRQAR
jgi:hypothetical protein